MDDPHYGLHVIRDQRRERAHFAARIEEELSRTTFYSMDHAHLARTIRQALHEDEQYQRLTGEPMPEAYRQVLRGELSYWMTYDDLLTADPVREDDYERFCADLRPRAGQLTRLLALEEDMLGTSLVAHYASMVGHITGGTSTTSPTRNAVRALIQLREDRQERRRLAHNTYRHVLRGTFFDTGTTDLNYAMHHAPEDQAFYEDATGDPYPPHAIAALNLEMRCWNTLLRVHERGTPRSSLACQRLRPAARALERVLELADELLTNPLVEHYTRAFVALEEAVERESQHGEQLT